jgi:RHS repeat-associated protein
VTGEVRRVSGYIDQYGFTGQARDESTGLLHFQFRYLDTDTGRWLSPDPLFAVLSPATATRLGESTVAYGYVANNPVNHVDPTGLYILVLGMYGDTATLGHQGYLQANGRDAQNYVNRRAAEGADGRFFKTDFRRYARGADAIHFNLNGMTLAEFNRYLGGNVRGVVAGNPDALNGGDITNFELDTILGDKTLRNKTRFHLGSAVHTDAAGNLRYRPGSVSHGKYLWRRLILRANPARATIRAFHRAR